MSTQEFLIEAALSVHKGTAMISSISMEKDRYDAIIPIVAGTDLKVIALCMSDEGMAETVNDRMSISDRLINGLNQWSKGPGQNHGGRRAPVTKNYANESGADGYAHDAGSAAKLAKALLQ